MSTEHGDTWKLFHPELLSQEELLHVLNERQVNIDEITSQDKWKLVEMFKRVVMPQSQRTRFQDKTTSMEIDGKSPSRINISSRETSLTFQKPNLYCISSGNFASQPNKIKLKRPASHMSESPSTDGPSPNKKREKITWP